MKHGVEQSPVHCAENKKALHSFIEFHSFFVIYCIILIMVASSVARTVAIVVADPGSVIATGS